MKARCCTCMSWNSGECRRNPPTVVFQNYTKDTVFPTTRPEDWCRERTLRWEPDKNYGDWEHSDPWKDEYCFDSLSDVNQ